MKATDMLKQQHRKVEAIFKKLEGPHPSEALVTELATNLVAHMAIEQDIFYPAVREVDEDLVGEAFEEHAVAELALKRLLETKPNHATFLARVTTLKELIEHHVKEEEEELFPAVEKAMEKEAVEALAAEMKPRFEEAVEAGPEALLPRKAGLTTTADLAQDAGFDGKETTASGHASGKGKVAGAKGKTAPASSPADKKSATDKRARAHS